VGAQKSRRGRLLKKQRGKGAESVVRGVRKLRQTKDGQGKKPEVAKIRQKKDAGGYQISSEGECQKFTKKKNSDKKRSWVTGQAWGQGTLE